jgi:glycosyltransferase involved in cell wall biosynthesis
VITVSQHLAEHLGRHYPGTPIHYIPNGIQAPEGRPSPAALAPFNLTPGRYVLAVGRIDPGKGFHDLIHAFRKIDTAWKLVIVGGCEHANAYSRSLASLAKADRRIVLTGFQRRDSLQALYAHAGLFVLPSYHEGLPIVALEAISFGLPILLSDIPANREVAETFELFPPGNRHRLQSAIEAFLTNSSSGTITGTYRRRQARIVARFSWPGVSAATADAYRDVLRAA